MQISVTRRGVTITVYVVVDALGRVSQENRQDALAAFNHAVSTAADMLRTIEPDVFDAD